jgi:hypothetical protein
MAAARKPKVDVDEAFAHLAELVTTEAILRRLDRASLSTIATAAVAILHAQENDPDASGAVTPVETLRYAVPMLNDNARNVVGSIACALINMGDAVDRNSRQTYRVIKRALDRDRRSKKHAKAKTAKRKK